MVKLLDTAALMSLLLILILSIFEVVFGQRVVPGVNPQHYQQVPVQQQQQYQQHHPPPPQYQQQHQQQQYQQPNVQYQQVPVQQQQAPQQMQQQVPVQQQHQQQQPQHHQQPHGHHGQPAQVLHASNMNEERAHIQEHMQVPIDTSKMSEAELQFHYFKMHDSDNNNKLDGCELIKSLIHWHEQGSKEQHNNNNNNEQKPHIEEKVFTDEELVALIDPILQMDDTSRDGFIDYPEFIKAQQKAAAAHQQQQQQQPQQAQPPAAEEKQPQKPEEEANNDEKEDQIYSDQTLGDVVDHVLKQMDFNNDGYVDYTEYRRSEDNESKDTKNQN